MKRFFITVIGTVVGIFAFFFSLILLMMLFGVIGGIGSAFKPKDEYVLTMDLRYPLRDHSAGESLFGSNPLSVVDVVLALNSAKNDDTVKGVLIRANEYGMVPASAEEIRLAIKDFKSSGKFVVTHSQGFEGTSFMPYLAVSASDEIWQQDTSDFAVSGIRSEVGFYKGVFDKIDAVPQIEQFHEYKSAANAYMQSDFTDAHREATTSLLNSLYNTAVAHIAEDRELTPSQIEAVLNGAPHSAEAALDAGMTDKLGHFLDAKEYAQDKAGGEDVKFMSVRNYQADQNFGSPTIAFVGGQGPVVNGQSSDGSSPFSDSITMGGDTVSEALAAATKDKSVKAIVFRVSTPGGSAIASDQILDAVEKAKAAGKPVVISMGQYAASGGYYVSAKADEIVAMPMTITGSIGVLGGKVALRDSFAKIGYNIEDINVGGEFVGAFSGDEPFTQAQRAAYREQLADIYEDFTSRVADGRDIPIEEVLDIAKGRVWTGEQAEDRGLVDTQGGLLTAIAVAKRLADIDEDKAIYLKQFPRPKSTTEQLEEIFGNTVSAQQDLAALREIADLPEVQALLKARAGLTPGEELKADIPVIQ